MKNYATDKIRNIAIVGHGGEGKTTLTEGMLFNANGTDRFGRVEDGTTITDYDPEEIQRQISISAALAPLEWNNHKINVIDVPGYFDFVGEMLSALRVVDSAVLVVGAVSGLMVGTEKAWEYCESHVIPRLVFINQMDRENADFSKALDQLKEKYGNSIAPFHVPIMENGEFKGIVDALRMKARLFNGNEMEDAPIPESMMDEVESIRVMLVEAAVETSEELMEKYFEDEEITDDEIRSAIRHGVLTGEIVPILCGSAINNAGIDELLDEVVSCLPSPCDRPAAKGRNPKTDDLIKRDMVSTEPFSALVFKTIVDPFVGKLSIFKVMSGELEAGTTVFNSNKDYSEKTTGLYALKGKKQEQIHRITAGDFGAFAKLQQTQTGDTLCIPPSYIVYKGIEFPEPSISLAVEAEQEGEEDKVFGGLNRMLEEDPTFRIETNPETNQTLISGMGEMQLDVIANKLKSKFGAGIVYKEPRVAYRETIRSSVQAEGRHKKQSGGHGQFGHIWVEFEPLHDTEQDFEFVDKVVGGAVPRQYIPAVEKGLEESLPKGVLAGYPVVGLKATLYDGSSHSVDSSDMAFKLASYLAFRKLDQANPILLEPIMKTEVIVPEDYMGDIIGDLNRRRGRILGMTPMDGGLQCIEAEVPQAEMFKYATDLRSMTQARGNFNLDFVRYEEVPSNLSEKIIEQAKIEAEAE